MANRRTSKATRGGRRRSGLGTTRRAFLQTVGAAAGGLSLAPYSYARVLGANEAIRIGVAGFHGHGKTHIARYLAEPGVRVVALCDPDRDVLGSGLERLERDGVKADGYADLRRLLERPDIDAISGATPNHWHALSTVWACQAGKHACVEKPVSHCIWEGRKMVEASRKYNRLVQGDLDRRMNDARAQAIAWMRAGNLGRILRVHAFVYKRRESIGKVSGPQQPPPSVDYNLWCGPRPVRPLMRRRLHYDWHWQFAYGNGETGNNGPHVLDDARWALGEPLAPRRVISFGGRFGYVDDGDTPNTQLSLFLYDSAPIVFEVRGLPRRAGDERMDWNLVWTATGKRVALGRSEQGPNNSVVVVCEGGYLWGDRAFDNDGKLIKRFEPREKRGLGYWFTHALRTGKREDLRIDIEQGHISTSLCHLANISYRIGREADPEDAAEAIKASPPALQAYALFREHLAANGVNLKQHPLRLGPWLEFDPRRERFVDGLLADRANQLLKDAYRAPFVIPDAV